MKRRPWGTGTIERQGKRFRARFPFRTGQREEIDGSPFDSYEAAEAALDAILEALRDAGAARGGKTLLKLGESVLDRREKEGYRSVRDERNRWKSYVSGWAPAMGPARLVTRIEVRDWLAELAARGLAVQTRRNALNLLRTVFAVGLEEGHVDENPCIGLKVKSHGRTDDTSTWLTAEEVERLVAVATDPAIALAIGTGMRSGELRALRWEDVHADHIVIRFGAPQKPRKNGRVHRVPILPLARQALDALPKSHPIVLVSATNHYRPKGRIVSPRDWKAWLKAAGITRRVRTHDLRHTTATLLLTGAWGRVWSLEEVKEMLGHSSIKVTERYARATGTLAERAAREMGGRPEQGPKEMSAEASQAREILGRRGSDSNRRMTVLQFERVSNASADFESVSGLAWAFLEAVAAGDPRAVALGLRLADACIAVRSAERSA